MEKAKDSNIIGILVGTLGVGMHISNLNKKYILLQHDFLLHEYWGTARIRTVTSELRFARYFHQVFPIERLQTTQDLVQA